MNELTICELCEREMELTFHHLIPRTCHTNKWFKANFAFEELKKRGIMVCKDCHKTIHQSVPNEKELGKHYNTKELILEHTDIKRFIEWVKVRPNRRYR